ncbi:MAG: hypothetical protein BGO77_00220 [Caedibacter sp. 37-49]|nr:MAG: hypothetical protein BGO77_00220 [Caedibacter sp. 37-49]
MLKNFFYNLIIVGVLSVSHGFSSSQAILEEALSDDEHCLQIAKKAIQIETIATYEPFNWQAHGFDFTNEASVARAQRLHDALKTYFEVKVADIFAKKVALRPDMPEYAIAEAHYKLYNNYKASIEDLFSAAYSATFCGQDFYNEALKSWYES